MKERRDASRKTPSLIVKIPRPQNVAIWHSLDPLSRVLGILLFIVTHSTMCIFLFVCVHGTECESLTERERMRETEERINTE